MNIIFCKHPNKSHQFAFTVPDNLVPYITKDMDVLVETKKGLQMARTVTGIFSGDGAMDVAKQNGAYEPIKPVVSIMSKEVIDVIRVQVKAEMARAIFAALNAPPCPAPKIPGADWIRLHAEMPRPNKGSKTPPSDMDFFF